MECKIALRNHTSLQCITHQSENMSPICEVAETELRNRIRFLESELQDLKAILATWENR